MKKLISILLALAMILSLSACAQNEEEGFSKQTKQAVADFVTMYGKDSEGYNGNAYVVSDFDNTTSVFDITYQTIAYQLEHMAFAMNPDELKVALSSELNLKADDNALWVADTTVAYAKLWAKYGPFTAKGADEETMKTMQSDPWWMEFAAKMRAFLYHVAGTYPYY